MTPSLALMCGAGALPARMAAEARRHGWRVVAFAFAEAPGLDAHVDLVVPSRITALGEVLARLTSEHVSAAIFSGKFWMGDVLHASPGDADGASRALASRAGSLADAHLSDAVVATLAGLGVDVLDQRSFVGDWIGAPGCWTKRQPTDGERVDVTRGMALARTCADAGIGQTLVLRRGVVLAVEAVEGTTAAIRRGSELGGAGAVVVKAVAANNDYRFDAPAIGPETIQVAADGGVSVVAVEAGRVLLVDRDAAIAIADRAGIAIVTVDGGH